MLEIIIFSLVLFTGLYFIRRGERKEKQKAKIIEMQLDEHEEKISK